VNLSGGSEELVERGPPAGSLAGLADDDGSVPVTERHISKAVHRVKNLNVVYGPWALVARPVNKAEVSSTPAAEAAVAKEWQRLRSAGAWDESVVVELSQLKAQFQKDKKKVHIGRVFELCHEKGSELPLGDLARKFKGRVVFMGNQVRDEQNNTAIFSELSSAPATMEAAKAADVSSLLPGHSGQTADGDMAYIQARLEGTETWVLLPRHRWPSDWVERGSRTPRAASVLPSTAIPTLEGIGRRSSTLRHGRGTGVSSRTGPAASSTPN
jgi:hypothetical protein